MSHTKLQLVLHDRLVWPKKTILPILVYYTPPYTLQYVPARCRIWLHSSMPNTESDSAVSCPTQSLTLQYLVQWRVRLCSILPNAESDYALFCPMQSPTPQYPTQRRVWLWSILPNAESNCAVPCPTQSPTPQYPAQHRVRLPSILSNPESLIVKYLAEIETIFINSWTVLIYEGGPGWC